MKKFLLPLLMSAVVTMGASAEVNVSVTPLGEHLVSTIRKTVSTADILVMQDFSDLTTPFIEGPVSTADIAQPSLNTPINMYDGGPIPAEYMGGQEGWRGANVYSNDGTCVIQTSGIGAQKASFLDTPLNEYSGSLTISFIARYLPTYGYAYNEEGEEVRRSYTGSTIQVSIGNEENRPVEVIGGTYYDLCDVRLYAGQGWCEVRIDVDNLSAYNDAFLRFFTYDTVEIDDIKVTSSVDNFIAAPVMESIKDVTDTTFTINWEPVRKAFNYYVYLYTLEGYDSNGQPIFLPVMSPDMKETADLYEMTYEEFYQLYIEDWDINEPYAYYDYTNNTYFTFTDLDPNVQYYFAVRSHFVSTFSDLMIYEQTVLATPVTLDATGVETDSFTAEWKPVGKADCYYVTLYGVEKATKTTDEFVVLEDEFDKAGDLVSSAISSPEEISPEKLNDYTDMPGWSVVGGYPLAADGHIGLRGYYGGLVSPQIYLKNAETTLIQAKVVTNDPDSYGFYLGSSAAEMLTFCEFDGGEWEGVLEFPTNGAEWGNIQIIDTDGSDIFIDYIAVTRNVTEGENIYIFQGAEYVQDSTSVKFTDLNIDTFSVFGYSVVAVQQMDVEQPRMSAQSPVHLVDLGGVGMNVDDINAESEISEIYTTSGHKIKVPVKGINIIRYKDGSTKKIMVK